MHQAVPVRVGSAEFLVETARTTEEDGGLSPVSGVLPHQADTFDRVREMIEAISGELVAAWEKSRPSEAIAEFGVAADIKAGRLTGLLVGAGASASLKITLKWTDFPGQ